MKLSTISKILGTSLLAVSLTVFPLTTSGQAQIDPETEVEIETEDDGFDWGLLGLLGLFGLAGLAGKNKQTHYETRRDVEPFPEAPGRSSTL